jgi:hypothetical protein
MLLPAPVIERTSSTHHSSSTSSAGRKPRRALVLREPDFGLGRAPD